MKLKLAFLIFLCGFLLGHAQINSIAIVGENAGGWPGSPGNPGSEDLHQMNTTDGENWSLQGLTLSNPVSGGGIKFRANNEWNLNWGLDAFPSGVALQNGPNIIGPAGTYDVVFNSTTGAYTFTGGNPPPTVKLVGTAAGLSGITLSTTNGILYTISNTTLLAGNAQFEVDGMVYGGDTFPSGTATDTLEFIPVVGAAYSSVTFNLLTREYLFSFAPLPTNTSITITGSATGNTNLNLFSADGVIFSYYGLATTQGELHFVDNITSENYGSSAFPTGIATLNGDPIVTPAGTWNLTFNIIDKSYTFSGTAGNPTISIVGACIGGWPGSNENPGPIDLHQMVTEDGIVYTIYALEAGEGEVKFRQNNDWAINWGIDSFPTGIAIPGGINVYIPTAGTYTVTFNRITGEYNFGAPNRIAIVGTGVGGWPVEGEMDTHLLESTDGIDFRLNGLELTDGEVKFRQNNSWDMFWGGSSLSGNLVLFGPAIPTIAGTYSVALNKLTGDYSLSTRIATLSEFKIYPNPTANLWNFTAAKLPIETIQIIDVSGKVVMTVTPQDTNATVDATSLTRGLYFAKIATANATETVKLMKN